MTTYEIWTHRSTGDVYAFRLDDGHVTGCCGPLTLREMAEGNLAEYRYDDLAEGIRRVADSPAPFCGEGSWMVRESLTPRISKGGSTIARALERVAARRRARH